MNPLSVEDQLRLLKECAQKEGWQLTEPYTDRGISYGYDIVRKLDERGELIRGLRAINPDEAEVAAGFLKNTPMGNQGSK